MFLDLMSEHHSQLIEDIGAAMKWTCQWSEFQSDFHQPCFHLTWVIMIGNVHQLAQ